MDNDFQVFDISVVLRQFDLTEDDYLSVLDRALEMKISIVPGEDDFIYDTYISISAEYDFFSESDLRDCLSSFLISYE